jgi:hypothetical protein
MEIIKGFFEIVKQIPTLFRLHHDIINVGLDVPPNLGLQGGGKNTSEREPPPPPPPVLEAEGHLCIIEDPKWCDKCYFFFIINSKANLMIAQIGIQKSISSHDVMESII